MWCGQGQNGTKMRITMPDSSGHNLAMGGWLCLHGDTNSKWMDDTTGTLLLMDHGQWRWDTNAQTIDGGDGTPLLMDCRQCYKDTDAHGLQMLLWSALYSSLVHFQTVLTYYLLSGITSFVYLSTICLLHCFVRIPSTCNPICCVWKEWLKEMSNRPGGSVVKLPVTLSPFSPESDLLLPLTTSFLSYIHGVSLVTKKDKSKVVFLQKAI